MKRHPDCIDLYSCQDRHLYRLSSRNLSLGIFRKEDSTFLGIRTKFGSRFLDNEDHWDLGPPYGTANPIADLGLIDDLKSLSWGVNPKHILLKVSYPTQCYYCGGLLSFEYHDSGDITQGGIWKGCLSDCSQPRGISKNYTPLFDLLSEIEKNESNNT